MVVKLNSFRKNGSASSFNNASQNSYNILNCGETLDTVMEFTFTITGLKDNIITSIKFDSIFSSGGNFTFDLSKDNNNYSSVNKTINTTSFNVEFNSNLGEEENNSTTFVYQVTNRGNSECEYGLQGFIISTQLQDNKVSFSGPLTGRTANNIDCSVLTLNKGSEPVTFSKNPTRNFDSNVDNVQGQAYFRQNGIFVDGYQYGVNAPATTDVSGIVKLSNSSFEVGENNTIIPPNEPGIAATPQLVYNTLATAKQYVDDEVGIVSNRVSGIETWLEGVEAPIIINIEDQNNDIGSLGDTLTFSNDFEQLDNKLYIKWLELI